MKKAKVRGIAALFAALFALMLAAFLCMNVPVRDVRAADETETAETYDMTVEGNTATVSSWQDMLSAFTNSNVSIIKLGEDITFDFISDDALKTAMTTAGMPGYALYVTRDLELDLNGKTLRVVTDYISSAIVYYQSTGVDVTIRNGTLSGKSSENFIQVGTREDGSSTLTLEDVRIDFTNANGSSANTSSAILVSGGLDLNNVTFDVTNAKRVSVADGPVGTVTYATLQDAVNAADNGETVTLSDNVFEDIVVAEG